jgi:hypothetical protein
LATSDVRTILSESLSRLVASIYRKDMLALVAAGARYVVGPRATSPAELKGEIVSLSTIVP